MWWLDLPTPRVRNDGFPLEWKKKQMLSLFIKKRINKHWKLSSNFTSTYLWENVLTLALWRYLFSKNNLLPSSHSEFRPGDSCNSQFLSIDYEILRSFNMRSYFMEYFLITPKLLTKYCMLDWFLRCVKIQWNA